MRAEVWGAGRVGPWRRHVGGAVEDLVAGLGTGDLASAFAATARCRPDTPALRIDDEAATHGELSARAAAVAGWLRQVLPIGARVVVAAPNSLAMVTSYLGILRAGCVAVLAGPTLTPAELRHLVTDAGAAGAFGSGPAHGALTAIADEPGSPLGPVVHLDRDLDAILAEDAPAPPLGGISSGAPAVLAYTSGTTGVPKGVPLTHGNLLASIRAALAAWHWRPDDVLIHALPLTHQHGLGGIHAALLTGSRTRVLSAFDPRSLARAAAEERATVLFAVPAMYERLVTLTPEEATPLRALRLTVSGSAPLPPTVAARVAGLLGQPPLERYGTTESGLDVSVPCDGPRMPGSVGLPLPGVELRIADGVGRDTDEGEILLRGPQVFTGYRGRPDATAEAFHPGGWFRTGDLGRLDPATGYLIVTGRAKDLIITGGLNVYPREVELALESHPSVGEAGVAGLPSERWGEEVTAWIVPALDAASPPSPEALLAHARTRLAPYKCPKRIFVVDALPHNAMGKLLRRSLTPPPHTGTPMPTPTPGRHS